jgi:hypothetical protein
MKAYGSGCIEPHILDLGTSWRWVVSFTPRPLYLRGNRPPYPLDRRFGGPQSRSGRFLEKRKFLNQPRLELWTFSRPARSYPGSLRPQYVSNINIKSTESRKCTCLISLRCVAGCEAGECTLRSNPVPGCGVLYGSSGRWGELSPWYRLQRENHGGISPEGPGRHCYHSRRWWVSSAEQQWEQNILVWDSMKRDFSWSSK